MLKNKIDNYCYYNHYYYVLLSLTISFLRATITEYSYLDCLSYIKSSLAFDCALYSGYPLWTNWL